MEIKGIIKKRKAQLEAKKQTILKVPIPWRRHSKIVKHIGLSLCPEEADEDGVFIEGSGFNIDNSNKEILKNMLLYFTGNKSVTYVNKTKSSEITLTAKSHLDLNKGLCLIGGVGTGKTLLMKIFKEYTMNYLAKNSFVPYSAQEIVHNVETDGLSYLKRFGTSIEPPSVCYFDDVASANEIVNHFGTKTNVIETLISMRYDVFSRFGKLTHITTNKNAKELKELYGERVFDRMKEMFNLIILDSGSRRK